MSARRPIDDQRKAIFLSVLAATGSMSAAANAASPHAEAKDGRGGYSTFRDLVRRDPIFAEQVVAARDRALGKVEEEIVKRAFTPDERPIFGKDGQLLGVARDSRPANQMLLALARRLSPEAWSEKSQLQVDGRVIHEHRDDHTKLRAEHIDELTPAEQKVFTALLTKIYDAVEAKEASHEPRRPELPAARAAGDEVPSGPAE